MQLAGEPAQPAGPHADDAEDEEVKGCAVRARRTPYRLGADHANVGRRSRDGAPHAPAGRAPLGCRRVRCGRKRWQANEETSPQRRDGARRDPREGVARGRRCVLTVQGWNRTVSAMDHATNLVRADDLGENRSDGLPERLARVLPHLCHGQGAK